jgi:tryptophan-rich sensory protein
MKLKSLVALGMFSALTAGASLVGARVTNRRSAKGWYRLLRKPPQTPPDAVFGAVWPVLYGLTAYSGYRAWNRRKVPGARLALGLWGAQLAANAAWTPLFFGRHRSRAALVDLGVNFATLAGYTARVARVDRTAAALMAPYLAWLAFAGSINLGVVRRNPRLLAG